jgi:hypothetical protein
MTTAADTPTDVILGLVPRTHRATSAGVRMQATTVPQVLAFHARGWLGPRDKPEDDTYGCGANALAYEETNA